VSEFQLTYEQREALARIDDWYRLGLSPMFALTGAAGTGKTTLTREIVKKYGTSSTHLTAMTGKAAHRLSKLADVQGVTTLHKVLYNPPHEFRNKQRRDGVELDFNSTRATQCELLIVDEASMMSPQTFEKLKKDWSHVKVLLIGDPFQLPPILNSEEQSVYGTDFSVFTYVKGFELTQVMRNVGGVLKAATQLRETGELCLDPYPGYEIWYEASPLRRAVEEYCADPYEHLLLTWQNKWRMAASRAVRERFGHKSELPEYNEPVVIRKSGRGALNGDIRNVQHLTEASDFYGTRTRMLHSIGFPEPLWVSIEGGNPEMDGEFFDGFLYLSREQWTQSRGDKNKPLPITWAYCLTAHLAQGSEAERTTIFLGRRDEESRHMAELSTLPDGRQVPQIVRWLYTCLTRSKKRTTLIVGAR